MTKRRKVRAVAATAPMYANERLANDPIIQRLASDGRAFWQRRGVYVPANLPVNVADSLDDKDYAGGVTGRGLDSRYGQPRVVLSGYQAGRLLARARSKKLSVEQRRDAIWRLGQVVYHEEGHTAGIQDHTPSGLMGQSPSRLDTPWEVRQYAKQIVPKGRKVKRRVQGSSEDW